MTATCSPSTSRGSLGFTLIELLVVIAIIAVLMRFASRGTVDAQGGRPTRPVRQQLEAIGPWCLQLRKHQWMLPAARLLTYPNPSHRQRGAGDIAFLCARCRFTSSRRSTMPSISASRRRTHRTSQSPVPACQFSGVPAIPQRAAPINLAASDGPAERLGRTPFIPYLGQSLESVWFQLRRQRGPLRGFTVADIRDELRAVG